MPSQRTLADRLSEALAVGDPALRELAGAEPADRRDRALTLRQIHDLHRGPVHELGERVRWQHHPAVADLKQRLEAEWVAELDAEPSPYAGGDTAAAMRALAAHDRAPAIYQWIAEEATWEPALRFLSLEGGPDDLFDDLVATCQVGLPLGPAKLELAHNYWDELGNGDFDDVHNVLYRRFVEAVDLPRIPSEEQPTEALERAALLGLVATNRTLQPEMLGALGLIELEAGPHCRYVDQGWAGSAPVTRRAPSTRCTPWSIRCTARAGSTTPSRPWSSACPTGGRASCAGPPGAAASTSGSSTGRIARSLVRLEPEPS